jgi:general secretion pathway protein G
MGLRWLSSRLIRQCAAKLLRITTRFSGKVRLVMRGAKMSPLRSTIGLITIAFAVLLAQPSDQVHAKEAALKKGLLTLRQAIDKYTSDQHKAPQTLQDLIVKGYMASIPPDPITSSNSTWRVTMEDPAKSVDRNEPGIFDVHSGSDGVSSAGTRYADW